MKPRHLIPAALFVLAATACSPGPSWVAMTFEQAPPALHVRAGLPAMQSQDAAAFHLVRLQGGPTAFQKWAAREGVRAWVGRELMALDFAAARGAVGLVLVRHHVADVDRWLEKFKSHAEHRHEDRGYQAWGHAVLRDAQEEDGLYVMHYVDDLSKAKVFMDGADLRTAMAKGGVRGIPEFWYFSLLP